MFRNTTGNLLRAALLCGFVASTPGTTAAQDATDNEAKLTEAELSLKAAHESWQRCDIAYREFSTLEGALESEIWEYAAFVAELKYQAIVTGEVVRQLGGDVSQYYAAPEQDEEALESLGDGIQPPAKTLDSIPKRKQTREERIAQLEQQLAELGKSFDEQIQVAQRGLSGRAVYGQSNGGWAGASNSPSGLNNAGRGATGDANANRSVDEFEGQVGRPVVKHEPGAGPGVKKPGTVPEFETHAAGDSRDDDIVARQLLEVAEQATDPKLKKSLMDQYHKYKNR